MVPFIRVSRGTTVVRLSVFGVEINRCELRHIGTTGKSLTPSQACHARAVKQVQANRDRITMKLKRGTFTAIFFLACIAALELEQVVLEEI